MPLAQVNETLEAVGAHDIAKDWPYISILVFVILLVLLGSVRFYNKQMEALQKAESDRDVRQEKAMETMRAIGNACHSNSNSQQLQIQQHCEQLQSRQHEHEQKMAEFYRENTDQNTKQLSAMNEKCIAALTKVDIHIGENTDVLKCVEKTLGKLQ